MVRAAQGAAPHSAMALSKGTGEQVYLALRLALYRMLSDPADPCPIILDDALAYFDDERAALALQYLAEGKTVSAADHVPEYLRLSQAERERKEREMQEQ